MCLLPAALLCVLVGVVHPLPTPEYQRRVIPGVGQFDGPVVDTQYGPILGRRALASTITEDLVNEFVGIPFSEPPVGERRWQKPVPLSSGWNGTLNGTVYGPHCVHGVAFLYPLIGVGGETSEDCLTLNMFVPAEPTVTGPLPVMIYSYGGGFQLGTGEMYPGGFLATQGQVIVINYNYRTNTIGFLSTGDSVIPGNYGLWDTQAMLRWVQENIAAFGGDPERVTLFGQSAGGSVALFSMLSPAMSGLFHRAISISGATTSFYSITRQQRAAAFSLADVFMCGAQTSQEIRDCLMREDADDLEYWGATLPWDAGEAPWKAVIDGEFILQEPEEAWREGGGNLPDIDLIHGTTIHDAAGFILQNPVGFPLINDSLNIAANKTELFDYLKFIFAYAENIQELFDLLLEEYPELDSNDNLTRTLEATQAITDGSFEYRAHFEAGAHSRASPKNTYVYLFKHRQSFFKDGYPPWVEGSHLDDIYTFLGPPFFQLYRTFFLGMDFDQTDLDLSVDTIRYITNFAYTGNPNEGIHELDAVWPQYDTEQKYLVLNRDIEVQTPTEERSRRYKFWEELPIRPITPETELHQHKTPTKEELMYLAEVARYNLYERVGYYEPAMELVDQQADRAIQRMLERMEKLKAM